MASVGTETVEVVPDARGFKEKLEAQLRGLSAKLTLDTAEAQAKVAEIRAELEGIRDRRITVDDGGSARNVSSRIAEISNAASFAQAGVAAKTAGIVTALAAIIPIAAAATAAVAGIGLGIGIGALGVGIAALALNGVGSALSAGSGGGAAQSGQQRAQAVDQQRQAEVALTVAQRNAAQAQRDLTQARVDAAQALVDLSNKVTDNGLAQRQATLDLETAQRNLQVAKASPDAQNPANAGALAQVQLAFDQAKQNLTELQQAGAQLAAQTTVANAAGVAGSTAVLAAQNQVVDTQNALVEAQFQAADSAQKAADAAGSYGSALAKLNPAQQAFVEFLQTIQPLFSELKTAATNSFLPLLQRAIQDFLPVIGPVSSVISTIGTAFGNLADDAAKFFSGPVFGQFLAFLNGFLGPAIQQFGAIFGNVFTAGIVAFEKLAPLLSQFGDIFVTLSGDLATALKGGALDGFISTIQANLPQIGSTLSAVFTGLASILGALAPSAGPALQIIQQLAEAIGELAPVIGPLITLFLQLVNDALKPLLPQLVQLVKDLVPPLKSLISAIVPVAGQLVGAFLELVKAFVPLIPVISQLITSLLPPLINFLVQLIELGVAPLAEQIAQTLAPLLPQLADSFVQILNALTPLIPQLTAIAIQFLQQIAPDLPDIVKNFGTLAVNFLALLNALTPLLGPLTTFVTTFLTTQNLELLSGIAKSAADLVQALTDLVNGNFSGALKKLGDFFADLYNVSIRPIVEGIKAINDFFGSGKAAGTYTVPNSTQAPGLTPHRAGGGPVSAGQPYHVGESGWETFVPDVNGTIVDHAGSVSAARTGGDWHITGLFDPVAVAVAINRRLQFASA